MKNQCKKLNYDPIATTTTVLDGARFPFFFYSLLLV